MPSSLPYVDEHSVVVAAPADRAWAALGESLDGAFADAAASRYARIVGCAPATRSGPRPFAVGSTVPGFEVVAATHGSELVLEGAHRFSTYRLTFRLEPEGDGRTRLRAETHATFPGVGGAAYRLLVISSGGHRIGTRRLLAGVRDRAERAT